MNGSILTNARVPYALAADGLFPKALARLGNSSGVPVVALWIQGLLSAVLLLLGSFDQLTDYVLFAAWIFYGLSALAVFRIRRMGIKGAYQVPGYPWVPGVFIVVSVLLIANTLLTSTVSSLIGLSLIAAGIPVHFALCRKA
jgi:basic amino acid/polyamine antiporter, APA family